MGDQLFATCKALVTLVVDGYYFENGNGSRMLVPCCCEKVPMDNYELLFVRPEVDTTQREFTVYIHQLKSPAKIHIDCVARNVLNGLNRTVTLKILVEGKSVVNLF